MDENTVTQQVGTLRSYVDSGKTRSIATRKRVLRKLLAALKNNHDAVLQALKSDLNKSEGEAVASELATLGSNDVGKQNIDESGDTFFSTNSDDMSMCNIREEPICLTKILIYYYFCNF